MRYKCLFIIVGLLSFSTAAFGQANKPAWEELCGPKFERWTGLEPGPGKNGMSAATLL